MSAETGYLVKNHNTYYVVVCTYRRQESKKEKALNRSRTGKSQTKYNTYLIKKTKRYLKKRCSS